MKKIKSIIKYCKENIHCHWNVQKKTKKIKAQYMFVLLPTILRVKDATTDSIFFTWLCVDIEFKIEK